MGDDISTNMDDIKRQNAELKTQVKKVTDKTDNLLDDTNDFLTKLEQKVTALDHLKKGYYTFKVSQLHGGDAATTANISQAVTEKDRLVICKQTTKISKGKIILCRTKDNETQT